MAELIRNNDIKIDKGVYARKSKLFGYRLVFPFKNDDNTINWNNVITGGGIGRLAIVLTLAALLIIFTLLYRRDIDAVNQSLQYAINNPCEWCNIITQARIQNNKMTFNQSDIDLMIKAMNRSVSNGT